MTLDRLLTASEVAKMIGGGCGVETIRKAFRNGELAGVKLGNSYAFRDVDIEAWLAAKRTSVVVAPMRIQASLSPRSAARASRRSL